MAERRWVTAAVAVAVVAAAGVGAVLLWPDGSGTRQVSKPLASASPTPTDEVVDGIPNGSKVRASGTVAVVADRYRLCLRESIVLDAMGSDDGYVPGCDDHVYLRDDSDLLVTSKGNRRTVTGVWDAGWIDVQQVEKAPPEDYGYDLADPPCPTPAEGWAHGLEFDPRTPNIDYRAFDAYKRDNPHVVVEVASFRPSEATPVLTIASTDPAGTRAALEPAYPDDLCVVRSAFTSQEVHDSLQQLQDALHDNRLPGLYELGRGMTTDGQASIHLLVRNDRPEVEEATAGIPPHLLSLQTLIEVIEPA